MSRSSTTIALATLLGCACAPALADQGFQVASDPPAASVATSLGGSCVTPCTLNAPDGVDFTVTVSKPGFVPREIPVRALTGAYGGVVDHAPNPLVVALRPMPPVRVAAPRRSGHPNPRATAAGVGAPSRDVSLVGDGYVGHDETGWLWREEAPPPPPRSWSSETVRSLADWAAMR